MDDLVDFVACIDVSLEIPLARRLSRNLDNILEKGAAEEYVKGLRGYLDWYLNRSGRDMYYLVNERAKEKSDLVLDGEKPVEELAHQVVEKVRERLGEKGAAEPNDRRRSLCPLQRGPRPDSPV